MSADVIEVLSSGKTLYAEMPADHLKQKTDELQATATKDLKSHWQEKRINRSKSQYKEMISDQNKQIERALKLPLLSITDIASHMQNSDINAQKLTILANDKKSYLLVTYSADWCDPCHILSRELLTYFQEQQKNVDVNWVKLNR